jgi:hypothetical protein
MKDFDFEELDRAVSSALGGTSQATTTSTPEPSRPVVAETPKPQPVAEPVVPTKPDPTPTLSTPSAPLTADVVPVARPEPTPSTPVALANRRASGRFMDMVHPSSDMRGQSTDQPSVEKVEAPSITASPIEADASPAETIPSLESPFLPDAKVDKRPLGGSQPTGALSDFKEDDQDDTAYPDPIDFSYGDTAETPEEEHHDEQLLLDEPEPTHEEPEGAPSLEDDEKVASDLASIEHETASLEVKEEPVGPTSITQQYTEQPSSQQESGAIYDTEAYHQPLSTPPKKKSGLWVIVWVLGLVLVGAGAGVAVYLFVLPML